MSKLVIRLIINAVALWAAASSVAGIELSRDVVDVLTVALIFGIVNALIKPVVSFLSFPLLFLTLGLFTLVINTLMLLLTSRLAAGLSVEGLAAAFIGSIIISIVSTVLSMLLANEN